MSSKKVALVRSPDYGEVLDDVAGLLAAARAASVRSVNALMTATYWLVGRRLVEGEQRGKGRADYGTQLIRQLSADLTARFGRGFGRANLFQMRAFFLGYREIVQTASGQLALPPKQGASRQFLPSLASALPLPWSHYVRLLAVKKPSARSFYESEALRGGWTHRQLDRQIQSQFYERTLLSKNRAGMLAKGQVAEPADAVSPDEAIKDPGVWYRHQKEHWLGWLGGYGGPGGYGRKNWNRSAEFVFNHVVNPQMLIWLAEAVKVDPALVRRASDAALAKKSMAGMSAEVRRWIPWGIVEPKLAARRARA